MSVVVEICRWIVIGPIAGAVLGAIFIYAAAILWPRGRSKPSDSAGYQDRYDPRPAYEQEESEEDDGVS